MTRSDNGGPELGNGMNRQNMTDAESALRAFARTNRLRVTRCNIHNPNIGEPALLQVRFSQAGRRVSLRAAASLLELEFRCPDRQFGFAINRADKICLFNIAVPSVQDLTPWPIFVGDSSDASALREWLLVPAHRSLIERFGFRERESVQVFINGVVAVVEPTRTFDDVARTVISLADSVPPAAAINDIDCQIELPEDLRHLAKLFERWAISDDDERQERAGRSRKTERVQLRRLVEPLLARIDEYLDSLEEPLPPCARRLGYLAELVAELRGADPAHDPGAEILTEINARVEAELPLLPDHLRGWLETHLAHPREISVVSDPDGVSQVRVWLVTDDVGDRDASSRVVYDAARKAFGLVTELQNGVLWYMGPYGSLADTVDSL